MNLIAYSDSESDGEGPPAPKPALKQAPKPSFQKVIDRLNPGRIKVNLPGASQQHATKDDIETDAPPAKKPRLGGASAFGGFNAMLPAPKNAVAPAATANTSTGKRSLGKGLASGVNLKTGAEPAFKRESRVETEEYDENGNPMKKDPMKKEDFRALLNLPAPKSEKEKESKTSITVEVPHIESQPAPKPAIPRFVPMSVGKGKKKKPMVPRLAATSSGDTTLVTSAASTPQSVAATVQPVRKPKVSLFGVSQETAAPAIDAPAGAYKPMLYGVGDDADTPMPDDIFNDQAAHQSTQRTATLPNLPPSHDLTNIASELQLSEAERRQLFGKRGREAEFSSTRIVEFNTDTEYAHNEKLRQQGEQVQHNALKSISGTGKNSLRSLVNVASTQKDALEEHFAAGYRNKKEAGNKYGW